MLDITCFMPVCISNQVSIVNANIVRSIINIITAHNIITAKNATTANNTPAVAISRSSITVELNKNE